MPKLSEMIFNVVPFDAEGIVNPGLPMFNSTLLANKIATNDEKVTVAIGSADWDELNQMYNITVTFDGPVDEVSNRDLSLAILWLFDESDDLTDEISDEDLLEKLSTNKFTEIGTANEDGKYHSFEEFLMIPNQLDDLNQ